LLPRASTPFPITFISSPSIVLTLS
jgi:hypothetical protein